MRKASLVLVVLLGLIADRTPAIEAARLAGRGSGEAVMADGWDFYPLLVDGEPASIYLDLGLAGRAPIRTQAHMAYVQVKMRQPRADGLSSNEEFQALSDLEDMLIEGVAREGLITYAGRNTTGGTRDFYFYTADPTAFGDAVKRTMAGRPEYSFRTGGRPDPDWKVYFDFLYPSPDSFQRILNRRVKDQLTEHGDHLTKPRVIDHFAYLPTIEAARSLRDHLRGQGFTVDEPKASGDSISLSFHKIDSPADIDAVILPIERHIRELGGDYDGWGCEVTK